MVDLRRFECVHSQYEMRIRSVVCLVGITLGKMYVPMKGHGSKLSQRGQLGNAG